MRRKNIGQQLSNQATAFVWDGRTFQEEKQRDEVRTTKPVWLPHHQISLHSSPSARRKEKKRPNNKEGEKTREAQRTFILLENSSMLHTFQRKNRGRGLKINMKQIPNTGGLFFSLSLNINHSVLEHFCPPHSHVRHIRASLFTVLSAQHLRRP